MSLFSLKLAKSTSCISAALGSSNKVETFKQLFLCYNTEELTLEHIAINIYNYQIKY